jgi:hypothetical protein
MKVGLNEAKSQTTRSLSFDLSEDYLRLTKPEASWPEMALRQSSVRRSPLSPVGAAARTYPASNPCLSVARLFFSWFALGCASRCLRPPRRTPALSLLSSSSLSLLDSSPLSLQPSAATPDSVYNSDTAPPPVAASPLSRRSHPVRRRIPPPQHRPSALLKHPP